MTGTKGTNRDERTISFRDAEGRKGRGVYKTPSFVPSLGPVPEDRGWGALERTNPVFRGRGPGG